MISVLIISAVLIYSVSVIIKKLKKIKKGRLCSGMCGNCTAGCGMKNMERK